MALTILDSATNSAVLAATHQKAQIDALISVWAGGNVICRVLNGSTLLSTVTYGPWSINVSPTPEQITLGSFVSRVNTTTGTPTKVVFRAGSTDIFEIAAAVGSGQISFASNVLAAARENLTAIIITALASLPKSQGFTLTGPTTGYTAIESTFTVTPYAPVTSTTIVTPSASGCFITPATLTFTAGTTTAQTFTVTKAASGTTSVSISNNQSSQQNGSPISWVVSDYIPLWLSGASLHAWVDLGSGTAGANNSVIDAFSGFVVTNGGSIVIPAAGGHGDSSDNRVSGLNLLADAPTWSTLKAASSSVTANARYYPDGTPTSRHIYTNGFYVQSLNRVFLVGCTYAYGAGNSYASTDAFNLTTNLWDAGGTYIDIPEGDASGKRGTVYDGTYAWTNTLWRYNPVTNTGSYPISSRISPFPETPWAYDSTRNQLFGIQYSSGVIVASKVPVGGSTETAITFNSSSAKTQYLADAIVDPAMEYDPWNDRFLLYSGVGATNGRVYIITPNSGTVWDMSILSVSGTPPDATNAAGMQGRMRRVDALKGFVFLAHRTANLFFIKVA